MQRVTIRLKPADAEIIHATGKHLRPLKGWITRADCLRYALKEAQRELDYQNRAQTSAP
jgi:hypothetical protein